MARISYPEEPASAVARLPVPLNVFRMFSHAKELTGPAIDFGLAILTKTALPPHLRELIIMAVGHWTGCDYEEVQHAPIALDSGITPAELQALSASSPSAWARLRDEADDGPFGAVEHAVLTAVAQLTLGHSLSSDTLGRLRVYLTDQQVVEATVTVGYYTLLANLINALAVDVDPLGEHLIPLANRRSTSNAV